MSLSPRVEYSLDKIHFWPKLSAELLRMIVIEPLTVHTKSDVFIQNWDSTLHALDLTIARSSLP